LETADDLTIQPQPHQPLVFKQFRDLTYGGMVGYPSQNRPKRGDNASKKRLVGTCSTDETAQPVTLGASEIEQCKC
jgi:hypothetical protein